MTLTMTELMKLRQGDLRLLETEPAKALLSGRDPARVAYVAADGTPGSTRPTSSGTGGSW